MTSITREVRFGLGLEVIVRIWVKRVEQTLEGRAGDRLGETAKRDSESFLA